MRSRRIRSMKSNLSRHLRQRLDHNLVAANEVAQKQVDQNTAQLQTEIQNLKTELDLRREMAGNAPTTILKRAAIRKDASKGIFQGDPLPNRLDRVENLSKGQ